MRKAKDLYRKSLAFLLVDGVGIAPTTPAFSVLCSTTELPIRHYITSQTIPTDVEVVNPKWRQPPALSWIRVPFLLYFRGTEAENP